jgi:hypothetical protein
MSNEKPVRITVGEVKEVAEATTIQAENQVSNSVSAVSYVASVPDSSGNSMVIGAGLVAFVLLVVAGYFGLTQSISPNTTPTTKVPVTITGTENPGDPGTTLPGAATPSVDSSASTNAPVSSGSNNAPVAGNNESTK